MAFVNSRRPAEEADYRPQDRQPETDHDRVGRYYRLRSRSEEERLPDNEALEPYPDSARDEGRGGNDRPS
jgi:hypothetical protein